MIAGGEVIMFCPGCGVKEDRPVQFCRTCGTDLRAVRESLEQPDAGSASAAAAREEIARAVAAKIKEGQWWQVGAMVPEVEKLFESPQERQARLQRRDEEQRLKLLRAGTLTAAVSLGAVLFFLILSSIVSKNAAILIGPALIGFLVGIGVLVNGLLFTVPKSYEPKNRQNLLNHPLSNITGAMGEPPAEQLAFPPSSVTEHTTQNLTVEPANSAPRNTA